MLLVLTHGAYFAVVVLLISLVPQGFLGDISYAANTVFILGFLGTWRYSWAFLNWSRAQWFKKIVFPRRKAKAHAAFAAREAPCHAWFMVTTYMMDTDVTLACYRSVFAAAAESRDGATVVCSVVDGKDERLIRAMYTHIALDMSRVSLVIDRIKSSGKRDAMARAMRIIAKQEPTHNDIVIFVDGDTCVPLDIVAESAPCFTDPKVGAVTTDEGAIIHVPGLYRDWFDLRFDQRQMMMCSTGLAKRVLTLTGRMSVFRADLATNPEFIEGVDTDYLDHWRHGRVAFLTGDDKSTWFWLLKHGFEMHYLPDVRSWSYEAQPKATFYDSAKTLMVRWFGNMMRNNDRARRLGPRRIGFFTWWSIIDQRVSMWTTLVGPTSIAIAAVFVTPLAIPLYVAWVMMTRYVMCAMIAMFRGTWFPVTHPFILYFGQIAGSVVKTYVWFRLDKQKWTRQGAGSGAAPVSFHARLAAMESTAHHTLALAWLAIAVILMSWI
jgi:mannuronan synthase